MEQNTQNTQLQINKVHQGDCLELMKLIPDKSIDLIIADLPYALSKTKKYTHCEWDLPIPLDLLWIEYERIIKDNSAIILTASQPFTSALVMSNLKLFKCEWIWQKQQGTNFGGAKYQPLKIHESVLIFSKGTTKYYPVMREGFKPYPATTAKARARDIEIFGGTIRKTKINYGQPDGKRYPVSIVKFNREAGFHPTQKPTLLGNYFLEQYSKPGDLILDNTAGSGSFLVSAKQTGRNFIGIEKEQPYVDICNDRLSKIPDINP